MGQTLLRPSIDFLLDCTKAKSVDGVYAQSLGSLTALRLVVLAADDSRIVGTQVKDRCHAQHDKKVACLVTLLLKRLDQPSAV